MTAGPLTDPLRETLALFDAGGEPRTTTEVATRLGIGRRSTYDRLDRLATRGRIETKKVGASARVWWRPADWDAAPGRTIRRERDLLEKLLETSPIGVVVLDEEGELVRTNDRAAELFDLSVSAAEGARYDESAWTLTDDEGEPIPRDEHPVTRALETGESVHGFRHGITFPDGTERWYSSNSAPVFDESGDVKRVVVAVEDVTQLKEQARRLERRREELESELAEVFDRISDGFYGLDGSLRFTYVNDRAEVLLDLDESAVLGHDVREVLPLTDRFEAALTETVEGGEPVAFEDYYAPLDAWFENVFYPSATGVSVYFRDVTSRKEREDELERYETLFETVDDGVYALDAEGRFVTVNEAFCELTGFDRGELVGASATAVHEGTLVPEDGGSTPGADPAERADQRGVARTEFEVTTKSGETVPCESRQAPFPVDRGETAGRCGVVRDISARIERERTLRKRVRQQEAVTKLGQRALGDRDLDGLMAEAVRTVAETLETDYCKVLDLDAEAERLLFRQGVGWDRAAGESATVSTVKARSQASYTLARTEPVVVEDLESDPRFEGSDLLTDHDVRSGVSVIVGQQDDPWGVLGAHDTDDREFSAHDVNFVQSVANILATAIRRHDHERELLHQRERLSALNGLNQVVREIIDAVVDQSTREEIEQTVCDRLAATESYALAWIGDVDVASQTVTHRADAGAGGYLDDLTVSVDPDDEYGRGPTGRAVWTGELQTSADVDADESLGPWREAAAEYGFRSTAAIPIVHEDAVYGVLNVYADRPRAFEGEEREMVRQLGEVVGQAVAATERKRALMSDELVELEFQIPNLFDSLGVDCEPSGTITFDHAVPTGGDDFLVYGEANAAAVEGLEALTAALPHWTDVTYRDGTDGGPFELALSEPPVLSALASAGGEVRRAVIENGDHRMRLHVPTSTDVRRFVDAVRRTYPGATLLKRRQAIRRDDAADSLERLLACGLTDRQRVALEAAHYAGYFEWPRGATAEDVAESLGVSSPTFHQHLRKAQQQVFESLLSSPQTSH